MKKKIVYIAAPLLALLLVSVWYINDYYHSDESVQQYFSQDGDVTISEIKDGLFLDGPGTENALIFYPGAKVEYTAYLPLFYQTAEQGTDVFLLEMPCNLAFLGRNRADQILEAYDYNHWYLGGHSLGGAMAADYCADNTDHLDGLILLAAYPTKSLRTEGFSVLSVYGSEDHVLNMEKYEQGKPFLPEDFTEMCIPGGNHAQFGNYGVQKGDGTASISAEEQQVQTALAISNMVTAK